VPGSDLKQLWADTSGAVIEFSDSPPVAMKWTEPSSLPHMTVAALAGHLVHSGILMVGEALSLSPMPSEPRTAAQLLSGVPLDAASATHDGVRAVAESQALKGREDLIRRARACVERATARLDEHSDTDLVAFPWDPPIVTMTLSELLRTRLLELVVHLDDLAVSVEVDELLVPPAAVAVACAVAVEIDIERYGATNVVRALCRSGRNPPAALRAF
jgi:hypothetical protein